MSVQCNTSPCTSHVRSQCATVLSSTSHHVFVRATSFCKLNLNLNRKYIQYCHSLASDQEEDAPRSKTPRLIFSYMNPEAAAQMEIERLQARDASLKEYQDLKNLLLKRTWRFGTAFSAYLLLTVSAEAAFSELIGAAASYGYLLWLIKDVDAYNADTPVPMRAAEMVEPAFARNIAKLGAAYRMSLNPRLLVLTGLVAACAAWNTFLPDYALGTVEQGCLVGGYIASYKVALILKIYDDLKPRALTDEELAQQNRPQLVELEDVPLNIKRPSEQNLNDEDNQESNDEKGKV